MRRVDNGFGEATSLISSPKPQRRETQYRGTESAVRRAYSRGNFSHQQRYHLTKSAPGLAKEAQSEMSYKLPTYVVMMMRLHGGMSDAAAVVEVYKVSPIIPKQTNWGA